MTHFHFIHPVPPPCKVLPPLETAQKERDLFIPLTHGLHLTKFCSLVPILSRHHAHTTQTQCLTPILQSLLWDWRLSMPCPNETPLFIPLFFYFRTSHPLKHSNSASALLTSSSFLFILWTNSLGKPQTQPSKLALRRQT